MSEPMTYIGVEPCGCVTGIASANPEHAKFVADDISDWLKSGRSVQQVPKSEAIARFGVDCPHQESQAELFEAVEA